MKKQNRSVKLLFLLLVLVLAVCAVFIVRKINEKKAAEAALETTEEEVKFTVFSTDGLQKISYETSVGYAASFEKEGETWYVEGDHDFPVDQNLLKTIEKGLTEITSEKQYEDLGDDITGLSEPGYTVTVTDANGSVTLTTGNETKVHGTYYSANGDGFVYLTDKTIYENFDHTLAEFMLYDEMPTLMYAKNLTVETPDRTTSLDLTDTENYDTYIFELLLEELQDIEFVACATYTYSKEDPAVYGLETPAMVIKLNYGSTGAQNLEFQIGDIADEEATYRYAKFPDSENVYVIYNAIYNDFDYDLVDGEPVFPTVEETEGASESDSVEEVSEEAEETAEEAAGNE